MGVAATLLDFYDCSALSGGSPAAESELTGCDSSRTERHPMDEAIARAVSKRQKRQVEEISVWTSKSYSRLMMPSQVLASQSSSRVDEPVPRLKCQSRCLFQLQCCAAALLWLRLIALKCALQLIKHKQHLMLLLDDAGPHSGVFYRPARKLLPMIDPSLGRRDLSPLGSGCIRDGKGRGVMCFTGQLGIGKLPSATAILALGRVSMP